MGNRAYIDGNEGGSISLSKGSDRVLEVIFMTAAGAVMNITGKTYSLEVYADAARSAAAIASHAGALVTASGGRGTITLTPSDLVYGPGTYYAHMKVVTTSGGAIEFIDKIWTVIID